MSIVCGPVFLFLFFFPLCLENEPCNDIRIGQR